MAKKKEKEVVEETTKQQVVEEKAPEEKVVVKEKPKMKKFSNEEEVIKIDLSKNPKIEKEDAVSERKTKEVPVDESSGDSKEVGEEKSDEQKEQPVIEEIKEEPIQQDDAVQNEKVSVVEEVKETTKEKPDVSGELDKVAEIVEEELTKSMETGSELPESIQKLMKFMNETGGDLNDYVTLNQDYSDLDNLTLLREYYKKTKPHLNSEEISFLMEDTFSYDEELDNEKDIKRKKLALKEQVAGAKSHLDGLKSKYYEDIKAGSKLTPEAQKAIDFFNRYNKESEENQKSLKKQKSTFLNQTDKVFNDKFKGFEYNIGEKKFRFNVKDTNEVKDSQSNINNFVKKFLNKNNEMEDARGYHKSLFTAMNPDAVANHFYEQGKADGLKESVAKSKNIDMNPRQQHSGEINTSGLKFKVLGDDSKDFKFKIKQNK